jgi:hypothetical protein
MKTFRIFLACTLLAIFGVKISSSQTISEKTENDLFITVNLTATTTIIKEHVR